MDQDQNIKTKISRPKYQDQNIRTKISGPKYQDWDSADGNYRKKDKWLSWASVLIIIWQGGQ